MKFLKPLLIALFIATLMATSIDAQGLTLNWSEDGSRCWYRVQTESGPEYRVVTVEQAESKPAFDHRLVKLAVEQKFKIADPVISRIAFLDDPDLFVIKIRDQHFRVDARDHSVTKSDRPESKAGDFRLYRRKIRSRDGQRTDLSVRNETGGSLTINWVDRSGRLVGYGKIESGEAFETGTWVGTCLANWRPPMDPRLVTSKPDLMTAWS